jgi:LacI family transcriptional regulator
MKFDVVTIKDIAKALNISKSTVSRALKNATDISVETKRRILEYAERNNYHPNPIASSLKEGKSYSIGVIVSEIANTFFSQVIDGIESVAYKKGYRVIIAQSRESEEREKINVEHLCSHSIDGLLISLSSSTSDISHLKDWHGKGLPIVFFDKISNEIQTHKVKVNNHQSAFKATEHLIENGYKKIAQLTSLPFLSNTVERLGGYRSALEKHGLAYEESLIKYCRHGKNIVKEVQHALDSLFANRIKPDAILCTSDRTTTSCFQVLDSMKDKYGNIGLAGFSNSSLFNFFPNQVGIVQQPAFKIGEIATELLLQIIESKTPVEKFETKVLNTKLIVHR